MYTIDIEKKRITGHHNYGFFSICNVNLKAVIEAAQAYGELFDLDCSANWGYYKDDESMGDIYYKFFKQKDNKFEVLRDFKFDWAFQFENYKDLNYDRISQYVDKYFSLSDEVFNLKEQLLEKYSLDLNKTISVLYRGNDKVKETPIPTYEDMEAKLNELTTLYPDFKIIIQSDEQEFCDFFKEKNNIIIFDEIEKISRDPQLVIQYVIPRGRKVSNAQTFLAILKIISESHSIILNSGNVGLFACLLRGNANNVYQNLNLGWL